MMNIPITQVFVNVPYKEYTKLTGSVPTELANLEFLSTLHMDLSK